MESIALTNVATTLATHPFQVLMIVVALVHAAAPLRRRRRKPIREVVVATLRPSPAVPKTA